MLQQGYNYTVTVISLQQNADRFSKRDEPSKVSYCHFLDVQVNQPGNIAHLQICTDTPTFNLCSEGDEINIKVTSANATKGRFTARFEGMVRQAVPQYHPPQTTVPQKAQSEADYNLPEMHNTFIDYPDNPYVKGTAMDCALGHAAMVLQNQPSEVIKEMMEPLAKTFFDMLKSASGQ